ncbi:extracellular protein [Dothistroma septosporum NZE10]|uniref:Extracellular protein n=1 Tax=Dothistroma septosporum (strain NZE10 / CBS 128990) TaxID=675120 RepID=N1PC90_DOTSN|nr:extracellular protein [Dothistroma septosporum NZE10]
MHFNAAAVLALLPALSLAAVLSPRFPRNAGNTPGSNMCDASTFNDGTTYDIPQAPVADCRNLVNSIDTSQTFTAEHSWSRPWTYGRCAFNVRVIAGSDAGLVGGADAADLLNDSSRKFGESGSYSCRGSYGQVVSAEGEVDCNAENGGRVRVEWVVADSSYNPRNDE